MLKVIFSFFENSKIDMTMILIDIMIKVFGLILISDSFDINTNTLRNTFNNISKEKVIVMTIMMREN